MINFQSGIMKVMSQTCFAVLALSLTACGGGGGGGTSSGTGGGSSGGGQQTTQATLSGLPTSISVETSEHAEPDTVPDAEFSVTVTGTPVEPTNFRLVGPDAVNFQVVGTFKATSNAQLYDVEVDVEPISELDFENPVDEGKDSTYEFDVVFTYDGRTYSFPVTYGVTNEEELFQAGMRLLSNSQISGAYYDKFRVSPDVTGDGKEDLLYVNNSRTQDFRPVGGIYSSQTLELLDENTYNPFGQTVSWLLFDTLSLSQGVSDFFVSLVNDGQQIEYFFYSNRHNNPSGKNMGHFVNVEVNDAENLKGEKNIYDDFRNEITSYVEFTPNADDSFVPDPVAKRFIYNPAGDIDGDGISELFYVSGNWGYSRFAVFNVPQEELEFGLVWGVDAPGTTSEFTASNIFKFSSDFPNLSVGIEVEIEVTNFPDIDGDGKPEIVFSFPNLKPIASLEGEDAIEAGGVWIIKSNALADRNSTTTKVFELDKLAPSEGIYLSGQVNNGTITGSGFGRDIQVTDGLLPFESSALVISDNDSVWIFSEDNLRTMRAITDANYLLSQGANRFSPDNENDDFLTTMNLDHDFDNDGIVDFVGSTTLGNEPAAEDSDVLMQIISGAQFVSRLQQTGGEINIPSSAYRNVMMIWPFGDSPYGSARDIVVLNGVDFVGAHLGAGFLALISFTDIEMLMASTEGVMDVSIQ